MKTTSIAPLSEKVYEIRVLERLDDDLTAWFIPLSANYAPDGATTLTVSVRDQAELHGLLAIIRDLNLTIVAILSIDSDTDVDTV